MHGKRYFQVGDVAFEYDLQVQWWSVENMVKKKES